MHPVEREHQRISAGGRDREGPRIRAAAGVRVDRRKIQRSLVNGNRLAKVRDAGRPDRVDAQERRAAEMSRVAGVDLRGKFLPRVPCLSCLKWREERESRRSSDQGNEDEAFGLSRAWRPGLLI